MKELKNSCDNCKYVKYAEYPKTNKLDTNISSCENKNVNGKCEISWLTPGWFVCKFWRKKT